MADEDNAWPYYQRAQDLYAWPSGDTEDLLRRTGRPESRTTGIAGLTDAERQDLTAWLSENRRAADQYVAASQKPYLWVEYKPEAWQDNLLVSVALPDLGWLRDLSKAHIWQARIALREGRCEEVLADCLAVARTARLWHRPASTTIEQMVACSLGRLVDEELLYMAASGGLPQSVLKDAQEQLELLYEGGWPPVDLEHERLMFVEYVQHGFTEGGPGGGHLVPRHLASLIYVERGEWISVDEVLDRGDPTLEELVKGTAGSMIHHRRNATLAKGDEVYGRLGVLVNMTPHQKHVRQISEDDLVESLPEYRHFLLRTWVVSLGRASHAYHQRRATHEATITVLALRRWFLEKGRYPDGLDELVDVGYITQAPDDPYSDGGLKYEPRGDDFVLYSLGGDFDDDGGVQTPDDPWGGKEEDGDRVFWPVE